MQQLLDNGEEANAQSGQYNTALQAVSDRGYDKVVQLLGKGVEVQRQTWRGR